MTEMVLKVSAQDSVNIGSALMYVINDLADKDDALRDTFLNTFRIVAEQSEAQFTEEDYEAVTNG